jgi:glycosyltransferase involved in cell wall biosynthesis
MKILIVSDAWRPQVNGVVRTLESTSHELTRMGHDVLVIGPDDTRPFTFRAPTYPQIKLEFFARARLETVLRDYSPDAVHIATEGPLGWAVRALCLHEGRPFTTSYQTNFPDYLADRSPRFLAKLVKQIAYFVLRRFHAPSDAVMVATKSIENKLRTQLFGKIVRWPLGVDTEVFKNYGKELKAYDALPRPILLNVGRVAIEKNLCAFLDLKTPGSKVVIGAGPDSDRLQGQYPNAHFLGSLEGENLARHYAAADVFVFPSKTETFGLVLLEACAAGLRIAAYPVAGPADLFVGIESKTFAVLDENLQKAVDRALTLPDNPENPRAFASHYSWTESAKQFLANV